MSTYRRGLAASSPALLVVPRVDEELDPLGDVHVAAIRAGQSEQVHDVGTISAIFGPSLQVSQGGETAGDPNPPLVYGDAAANALYHAHGCLGGGAHCFGVWRVDGLATEDKEKPWNWAVGYANAILAIQLAVFAFLFTRTCPARLAMQFAFYLYVLLDPGWVGPGGSYSEDCPRYSACRLPRFSSQIRDAYYHDVRLRLDIALPSSGAGRCPGIRQHH